jgi:hypothetical protein
MPFKVQQLAEIIMQQKQMGSEDAFAYLYHSDCYEILLDEEAKLWYMSGQDIFEMLEEEKQSKSQDEGKILLFLSFCLERYKSHADISAEETLFIFRKHGVFDYLRDCFDMLHAQGEDYIMDEIELFVKK